MLTATINDVGIGYVMHFRRRDCFFDEVTQLAWMNVLKADEPKAGTSNTLKIYCNSVIGGGGIVGAGTAGVRGFAIHFKRNIAISG